MGDQRHTEGLRARVLKFGSSVLRTREDAPRVVGEIYRRVRQGERVVAVVSAFAGETDALIDDAARFGASPSDIHAPRYIALGEARAAALLALACDQAGLSPVFLNARELGFFASGDPGCADPRSLDETILRDALSRFDVVIVPGFVAVGENGRQVLLGRGGTDLTAVVIADALGLEEATLIKDVDGVYDRDPAKYSGSAQRYAQIDYDEALSVAGALVQARALRAAKARSVKLRVGRVGEQNQTLISDASAAPAPPARRRKLRVALAGCGIVGTGVVELLSRENETCEIVAVLVRDLRKPRPDALGAAAIVTSIDTLLATDPDVVIDVLSSGDVGAALTQNALSSGVSVVTANKQAIADRVGEFHALAHSNGAHFEYSASVGGGAPMIETVRRIAGEEGVDRIDAVVNGTVNYILSALASGKDFDTAVKDAQIAGFAEADPTADLSGADAVAKAKILAWDSFQKAARIEGEPEPLDASALEKIAREPGIWKQLTSIHRDDDGVAATIRLVRVDAGAFLAGLVAEQNGAQIETVEGGVRAVKGRGAGAIPTAHSVCADLGAIFRRIHP